VTTTCIVLCAGDNVRWNNHTGVRKHLVEIEGEVLLARTLKQVEAYRPDRTLVVVREEDAPLYEPYCQGKEIYRLNFESPTTEAWKYLSSQKIWNTQGRTVSLLGDVWFSEEAMKQIFTYSEKDWRVFGRSGPSRVNGCPWGEIFAHSFEDPTEHQSNLLKLDQLYRNEILCASPAGWAHYLLMEGNDIKSRQKALDLLGSKNNGRVQVGPRFKEIDDFTDDFDYPDDLTRWNSMRQKN